jgi:adenine-specific DNA-methyltransferase
VLDFFAGSSTTAHAVMSKNAKDGGRRRFIMVQYPEVCKEGSAAHAGGYRDICEIGRARIRLAGDKIAASSPKADTGFAAYKIKTRLYNKGQGICPVPFIIS